MLNSAMYSLVLDRVNPGVLTRRVVNPYSSTKLIVLRRTLNLKSFSTLRTISSVTFFPRIKTVRCACFDEFPRTSWHQWPVIISLLNGDVLETYRHML